jgi:hypothetical protein
MTHDPARPTIADQRAVLAAARAVILGADPAAHEAAAAGACPACTTLAAISFGFALAASVAGETLVSETLRLRLLAAVNTAQAELDAFPN